MSRLWTPPGAYVPETLPRVPVPTGEVRLADGRVLRYRGPDLIHDPERTQFLTVTMWTGRDGMKVLASMDNIAERNWGPLLHVSMSYPHHDPSWVDIKLVRDAFFGPDVDVAMMLPRPQHYVNVHKHCFQMWQTPEAWGMM